MARSQQSRVLARHDVPAPLRSDVKILGELLGIVLAEYGGPELLDDVERLRELSIAARADDGDDGDRAAEQVEQLIDSWSLERAEDVARAFTCYFHLANVAEEYHRVRTLRGYDREGKPIRDSIAIALDEFSGGEAGAESREAIQRLASLEFRPVLTAHPTEARRRAISGVIRRIARLLADRDDPRIGHHEQDELRRRLLEEIDVLWRTSQVRTTKPSPTDEVRTAMAVFDETLFQVLPQVYRRIDDQLAGEQAGRREPVVPAFVRLGSWIGGDRDGNPNVTAAFTKNAMDIQADHVLRALERACDRIGRGLTADSVTTPPSAEVRSILDDFRVEQPDLAQDIALRSPGESHRQVLLAAAARLTATRERNADLGYDRPADLLEELRAVQRSLAQRAPRQAYGELQHLIWQVESFGFHLAELEVRQHSAIHARVLTRLDNNEPPDAETEEVLQLFRVMHQIQQRFGPDACRRYIVSFTQGAGDIEAVYRLARHALGDRELALDVIPLFETEEDLRGSVPVLEEALSLEPVRARLEQTGRRFEVMLGYSDSAKDVGPLSATLALYDAQAAIARWAERHQLALTLFHGRGGALGRGGGPANRAVLAQPPGSVAGRFKLTEQGEVIFARYGDPMIAARHIEQVAAATLLHSSGRVQERVSAAAARYAELAAAMDQAARTAYRGLVHTDGFPGWFARVTPVEEIGQLPIGSRPARRGLSIESLEDLRAIPWVFAWSQARVNLTGWYGVGTALEQVGDLELLRSAYAEWPLFTVLLDNVEMSLAKTDARIARGYLELGDRPDLAELVLGEHERTTNWLLRVTGRERLLQDRKVLGRAVELRNPYVDALSHLQLRAFRGLRGHDKPSETDADRLRRLLLLTVNGVAAGLQNTG